MDEEPLLELVDRSRTPVTRHGLELIRANGPVALDLFQNGSRSARKPVALPSRSCPRNSQQRRPQARVDVRDLFVDELDEQRAGAAVELLKQVVDLVRSRMRPPGAAERRADHEPGEARESRVVAEEQADPLELPLDAGEILTRRLRDAHAS
jgi:hypothetical protein